MGFWFQLRHRLTAVWSLSALVLSETNLFKKWEKIQVITSLDKIEGTRYTNVWLSWAQAALCLTVCYFSQLANQSGRLSWLVFRGLRLLHPMMPLQNVGFQWSNLQLFLVGCVTLKFFFCFFCSSKGKLQGIFWCQPWNGAWIGAAAMNDPVFPTRSGATPNTFGKPPITTQVISTETKRWSISFVGSCCAS